MDIINHQSNGAKGLRIAASICIVLGWIALIFGIIAAFFADGIIPIVPPIFGLLALALMYLLACCIRATATTAEASQLYINKNADEAENDGL